MADVIFDIGQRDRIGLTAKTDRVARCTRTCRAADAVHIVFSVLRQIVIQEPANQITVTGVEGLVDSVEIQGTIAYLNSGAVICGCVV